MAGLLGLQTRPGFLQGTTLAVRQTAARPAAAPLTISAKYRGKGTDLSKIDAFKKSDADSGSSEVQIARLSARVLQLTAHLQTHKKDYSTRRGLMAVLSQRKQLMKYVLRTDKPAYVRICSELNIRPLKNEL